MRKTVDYNSAVIKMLEVTNLLSWSKCLRCIYLVVLY
jgi:hypothetical protein